MFLCPLGRLDNDGSPWRIFALLGFLFLLLQELIVARPNKNSRCAKVSREILPRKKLRRANRKHRREGIYLPPTLEKG